MQYNETAEAEMMTSFAWVSWGITEDTRELTESNVSKSIGLNRVKAYIKWDYFKYEKVVSIKLSLVTKNEKEKD